LGFSAGLDFETKILVKHDAPALLRKTLSGSTWRPRPLAMSGVTDPYQPAERQLKLSRRCLEVMVEFRQAVSIITKNRLVIRDLDLLRELAGWDAAGVFISVTTLDAELARKLEPRTSPPERRLAAIRTLADAGIPTGVMAAPMIPGLNDHELPGILEAALEAGARFAGLTLIRLPLGVSPLFEEWLDRHEPGRKEKVLSRIRSIRGGRLNDSRFGSRMSGEGPFAEMIQGIFRKTCRRLGLNRSTWPVSSAAFRAPADSHEARQLRLFD
jgi:DNA repair photolyase